MKVTFEIEPAEVLELLQRLADNDGSHEAGPNSKVAVGENIVQILKREVHNADPN